MSNVKSSDGYKVYPQVNMIRSVAIIFVVLCHCTETIYSLNIGYIGSVTLMKKLCIFALFTIGRMGVPLFLFITGFLLLDRVYDVPSCINFWKKNWLRLVIATEAWIVIYECFLTIYCQENFIWTRFVKELFFLESVKMGHMWYMPMIIGMYILIPFVANGLRTLEGGGIKYYYCH